MELVETTSSTVRRTVPRSREQSEYAFKCFCLTFIPNFPGSTFSRKIQNGVPFLVLVPPPSHTAPRLPHPIVALGLNPVIMFVK